MCLALFALSLWPSVVETKASVTTLRIGNDQHTLCTGVGRKNQECLTVKDFTQEELLSILEPLLAKIPAESGRTSWASLLCSLVLTLSTWVLVLSCLWSCCRQKANKKTSPTCGLLRRWARDLCDVFFTFPLMGAKMILGKVIVAPITAACVALQDMQTEQTLRLQRQLLAEGEVAESSLPTQRKRERAGLLQRNRRRTAAKPEKLKEPSTNRVSRPIVPTVIQDHELARVPEEDSGVDWCQVQRHSEHPKRSAEHVEEPIQLKPERPEQLERPKRRQNEVGQSAAAKPMSHMAPAAPAIPERQGQKTKDERLLAKARQPDPPSVKRCTASTAPRGAPAYAPPPPSVRAQCEETTEVPSKHCSLMATIVSAPPDSAPLLGTGIEVTPTEEMPSARLPPPDVPPPPCPGHLEAKPLEFTPLVLPTRTFPPSDMGCLSGGTGGTPGLCDPEVALMNEAPLETESKSDSPWVEDDVARRLEAMVEELAGPSSFELLEDAFSKVDAAREALSKVVEPGLRLHHTAPAFIPGQMWPGVQD